MENIVMRKRFARTTPAAVAALLVMAGCSGGGGDSSSTGTLKLGLTDGPVESAFEVIVEFTGIELKPSGGPALDPIPMDEAACDNFDAATGTCSINLLDLVGTNRKVVFSGALPAGDYSWVRLLVNAERDVMDSYLRLTENGNQCSIWVPSGSQTGLKIVSGITVTANGVSDYTLDFDVRKSITNPPGLAFDDGAACLANYVLKPAIRIVDTTDVGSISGTVDTALLEGDASCQFDTSGRYANVAVYVFEDFDAAVTVSGDDIDGDAGDPISSASVVWDDTQGAAGAYAYEVGYLLAPNNYHLALTCTANIDGVEDDDYLPDSQDPQDFHFIAERPVMVEIGTPADGSFPESP
jgi:hypothetical protein